MFSSPATPAQVSTVVDHVDDDIDPVGVGRYGAAHRVIQWVDAGQSGAGGSLIGRVGKCHQHGAGTGNDIGHPGRRGFPQHPDQRENLVDGAALNQQGPVAVIMDGALATAVPVHQASGT